MGYELTDDDINRLWRSMFGWAIAVEPNDRIDRAAVRRWFASFPVVALADVERAMGPATVDEAKAAWDACMASGGTVVEGASAAVDSVLSRRRSMLGMPATEPRKPVPAHIADASQAYYAEFRADVDRKIRRYIRERGRLARSPQSGLTARTIHCEVATAMMSLYDSLFRRHIDDDLGYGGDVTPVPPTPPPDPEPSPPAADYMTFYPDRIEFRAKGDGEHDPVVAKITAGGLLMAMQAVTEIKRGNAS